MKRLSYGLLAAVLLLGGCGGSGSAPASVDDAPSQQQPQQKFVVPRALHQAVPPAPPNFTPKAPTAAMRAAIANALRKFYPRRPGALRRAAAASTSPDPIVRFDTSLGNIDVQLSPAFAPKNVANFLSYVNSDAYNNSFMHRSVPGFVIQGGGYDFVNGQAVAIPQQAAVANEYDLSNIRGTLAMALAGQANTATDQWFFNLADNSASLNTQDGGFTVIGNVVNSDGLAVMDAIAALQTTDASGGQAGSPFTMVPVIDYTSGAALQASNLVNVSIAPIASHPAFFNGEVYAGNGTEYLSFPNGNYFGYYSYLSDENYIYHDDLGFEYAIDAGDGVGGVYLYDFASSTFFYTSPSFPFPYLYDFTLDTVLYYYPDPSNAGRYTTNPRYFYDFNTGQIISK